MATITAGDFRNGKTFEMDGKVMQVVEFQHVKPGKGAAFVRTKMKNIITGAVTETSFNPTAKFEEAFVERKDMEYSYNDGDLYYFMDQETFDMMPLGKDLLGDAFQLRQGEHRAARCCAIRAACSAWSAPTSWTWRSPRPSPACPGNTATNVTLKPATAGDRRRGQGAPVHQHRRQDHASTPAPASTWAAPSKDCGFPTTTHIRKGA